MTLINTMARVSEINNLKWDDIDDKFLILRTRKAKNSNLTERKIPLNQSLKTILMSIVKTNEYVFTNPVTEESYTYRSKFLRNLCKKAKVRYFSFHAFRHLGASLLAESNVSLFDIQKLLGHSRLSTTDGYLRSLRPSLFEAVEKLSPIGSLTEKGGDTQTQERWRAQRDSNPRPADS